MLVSRMVAMTRCLCFTHNFSNDPREWMFKQSCVACLGCKALSISQGNTALLSLLPPQSYLCTFRTTCDCTRATVNTLSIYVRKSLARNLMKKSATLFYSILFVLSRQMIQSDRFLIKRISKHFTSFWEA